MQLSSFWLFVSHLPAGVLALKLATPQARNGRRRIILRTLSLQVSRLSPLFFTLFFPSPP
jgi:hypothetical protein